MTSTALPDRTLLPAPFLDLPAEMRNQIYGYCTLVNGHAYDYRSLILACKQINYEYEAESRRVETIAQSKMTQDWDHTHRLRNHTPIATAGITRLILELPRSTYWTKVRMYRERYIATLLQLHLSQIEIAFYQDKPEDCHTSTLCICNILYDLDVLFSKNDKSESTLPRLLRTPRLVITWPKGMFDGAMEVPAHLLHVEESDYVKRFIEKDLVKAWVFEGTEFLVLDFNIRVNDTTLLSGPTTENEELVFLEDARP